MNALAERYVKLVLALGQHDPDYVDAYYGPPEWRTRPSGEAPAGRDRQGRAARSRQLPARRLPPPRKTTSPAPPHAT